MFHFRRTRTPRSKSEQGYSWLFFSARPSWVWRCLVTLLVIGGSGTFFLWYRSNGDELTPSGNVGLSYALTGFACLLLAAVWYSVRRRLSEPALGQLNRVLNWHGVFALIALALLFLHSFANFGPNSGTMALFSLIALTLSGLLGRALDRVLAWRIAISVSVTLTPEGEDRLEILMQEMRPRIAAQVHETSRFDAHASTSQSYPVPGMQGKRFWDLSYRSLESMPRGVKRQGKQQRFLPGDDLLSAHSGTVISAAQMAAFEEIQHALQRERLYRSIIHTWRQVHIALAFLTLGLTTWHVVYEMPFLYHALFH